MSHILLDAQLLACPTSAGFTKDEFQSVFSNFLNRLCDLSTLRFSCKSVEFWRDEELANVLHEADAFPFRHALSQGLSALHDPFEFQLEDVNVLATSLLEKSGRLEDQGPIKDVVLSNCAVNGDPAEKRSELFLNHLCRVLALALPAVGDGVKFNKNTFLASCGGADSNLLLQASYTVELEERNDGSFYSDLINVVVEISNYRGMEETLACLNLAEWWMGGDPARLVEICAIAACEGQLKTSKLISDFAIRISIGAEFVVSADALGFMHDIKKINRIIRVCSDLLLDRNLGDSHWLRLNKGANSAQRVRGNWKAWRHDIDHEFHLHYWRDGNKIELANIVPHNKFEIAA